MITGCRSREDHVVANVILTCQSDKHSITTEVFSSTVWFAKLKCSKKHIKGAIIVALDHLRVKCYQEMKHTQTHSFQYVLHLISLVLQPGDVLKAMLEMLHICLPMIALVINSSNRSAWADPPSTVSVSSSELTLHWFLHRNVKFHSRQDENLNSNSSCYHSNVISITKKCLFT